MFYHINKSSNLISITFVLNNDMMFHHSPLKEESNAGGEPGYKYFSSCLFPFRIPLKKFRSIRRELTDSGKKAEELLARKHSLKYNFGFPSSNGPTPETLTNYLDVSITL